MQAGNPMIAQRAMILEQLAQGQRLCGAMQSSSLTLSLSSWQRCADIAVQAVHASFFHVLKERSQQGFGQQLPTQTFGTSTHRNATAIVNKAESLSPASTAGNLPPWDEASSASSTRDEDVLVQTPDEQVDPKHLDSQLQQSMKRRLTPWLQEPLYIDIEAGHMVLAEHRAELDNEDADLSLCLVHLDIADVNEAALRRILKEHGLAGSVESISGAAEEGFLVKFSTAADAARCIVRLHGKNLGGPRVCSATPAGFV